MLTDTLTDTLTTIEDQFFDRLKAVQDPALDAARKAAELVSQAPLLDKATAITAQLPSIESVLSHNFAFAQRLLDAQRDFVVELASVGTTAPQAPEAPKARATKRSAA